jgi:hypothetical protein
MTMQINGTSGLVFNDASTQNTSAFLGGLAFRNRIINGAMMIDQRNAGASVTVNQALPFWAVDRNITYGSNSAGVFTAQQSSVVPNGFTKSLICTVTTSSTPSAGQEYGVRQNIEGFNIADLGWGTANAQPVTISFWVRSSVTGTFAGSVCNSGYDRSYVFTYVVNSANTYEYKTVTIAGDTSGTWATDNSAGIRLQFNLGAGPSKTGTAGVWSAGFLQSATGSVNWIANSGATFYITGVQLEKGSTATSFDYRPYGTELALCQRYYYKLFPQANGNNSFGSGFCDTTTSAVVYTSFSVNMRTSPSAVEQTGTASNYSLRVQGGASVNCSSVPVFGNANENNAVTLFTVASGLTTGGGVFGRTGASTGTNAYLAWSAEL